MSRTSRQRQASRINGARSRGPVTPAGKARSAMNATSHGLLAGTVVLDGDEERAAFARLEADYRARYRAVDDAERHWLDELVLAAWRLRRLRLLELRVLDVECGLAPAPEGGRPLPSLRTLCRYRARIERDLRQAREALSELQARRPEGRRGPAMTSAALLWLAARAAEMENGTNEPGENTSSAVRGTNEPGKGMRPGPRGMNEPGARAA